MKPYYYVYRYGYGMPTARHKTLKDAQAEAERLAKKHQGFQFEILELKGLSSLHNSITFWADGVDLSEDEYVSDGHGNEWAKCGSDCDMELVRPGKVQCSCQEQYVEPELTSETETKQTNDNQLNKTQQCAVLFQLQVLERETPQRQRILLPITSGRKGCFTRQ
jgi:hypothetical protein